MRREFLMVVATMAILATDAVADNFTFSFTGGAGTVTGEIFGLQNDATGSATEVLITSYPASIGPLPSLIVTDWNIQIVNNFTETNGTITSAHFFAEDELVTPNRLDEDDFFAIGEPVSNVATLQVPTGAVAGSIAISPATVPEPSAWILLLTGALAVAIVKRSRRADGLVDPATE